MNGISKQSKRRLQLKKRSQLLQQLRAFFYERDVLEVDTPMLSQGATPDAHLRSLQSRVQIPGHGDPQTYYWHTSPEYPMKRLLCEGSGDIFYLGKVFRDGDISPRHQIEFTMLEWYRLGFSMQDLIDEVVALINQVLPQERKVHAMSYQQAFARFAGIDDIYTATAQECMACLQKHGVPEIIGVDADDKVLWEQLVLTEVIEPQLGQEVISVLYHFPARDASLAQIDADNPLVAERFEVFVDAMELANGYHELADSELYRERFNASVVQREEFGLPQVPLDERLLSTLFKEPLPDCSGVALGVDRLLMLQQGEREIEAVIPFGTREA